MTNEMTNSQVLLNAYVSEEQAENLKYQNDANFFEFFAASQILKEYDLSDEEVESGLCDGALDGGCDGIYLFADGKLVESEPASFEDFKKGVILDLIILQVKTSDSFHEDAIMKWKTTCDNLLDASKSSNDFANRYSAKVRASFDLFKKIYISLVRKNPKLNVQYFYVSKGMEIHSNVQAQASELEAMIKRLYPSPSTSVRVNFIGAQNLLDLAQKVINNEFSLSLAESPISNTTDKVFLVLVRLSDYYRFIVNENNELIKHIFEANVRDYQGNIAVNQGIHESLANPTVEDFWWLNNGVTIIASNATLITGKEMVISDPEIVNGLQTSTEIYRYFSQHPDKLSEDKRALLVRIIVPTADESRDRIIFATNNQTAIQKSSLRATDIIHRQIEMYFKSKDLYYDRRKNYYKNSGIKAAKIISVSFLSQCLIAVLLQSPNDSRARPSTLLTDDERYEKLYNPNQNLDVFYYIAKVGRQIEIVIKNKCGLETTQASDIKFYVLFAIFAKLFNKVTIRAQDIISMQIEAITDDLIIHTTDEVMAIYNKLGGDDRVAKGSELITELKNQLANIFVQGTVI